MPFLFSAADFGSTPLVECGLEKINYVFAVVVAVGCRRWRGWDGCIFDVFMCVV